jgi:hypothetical protein
MDERLAEMSLVDLEHREAISRVYLDLVRGNASERVEETSWQSVQLWIAGVRHRADQFRWLADGAVVLRFRDLGQEMRLVPDATIESASKPVRLFVELDQSNKPLSRIEENLERYAIFAKGHYRSHFGDGKVPSVVYVVRSPQRCANIAQLARKRLGSGCQWKVTTQREAAPWLAKALFDEARAAAEEGAIGTAPGGERDEVAALPTAAHALLRSTSDLIKQNPVAFDLLDKEQPVLVARWKEDLRALYELVREAIHGQ